MNELTAYRCFECGHYTISKKDGVRCAKCNGALQPMGNATCIDKDNALKVEFSALVDDPHTPNWIKIKIKELILKEI